jgi:uronate dehydrogenase
LRINSCYAEPADRRHLATWLSFPDLVRLVTRCLVAERLGLTVVYGISDNRERFFSNEKAAHLGYKPEDSAEKFRGKIEAQTPAGDPTDPAIEFVGGFLVAMGHPDDEI